MDFQDNIYVVDMGTQKIKVFALSSSSSSSAAAAAAAE